jgi:hypothetical protein
MEPNFWLKMNGNSVDVFLQISVVENGSWNAGPSMVTNRRDLILCLSLPKEPNFWFKMNGNSVGCFLNLCHREWELERRTHHGDQQTRSHFVSVFAKGAEFLFQNEWQQCFFWLFLKSRCLREWDLERRTQHGDQQTRVHPQCGRGYAW